MQSAAGYVDRILKGEKPADLPCSAEKGRVIIKTTTALDLTIPGALLARAGENGSPRATERASMGELP